VKTVRSVGDLRAARVYYSKMRMIDVSVYDVILELREREGKSKGELDDSLQGSQAFT